MPALAIAAVTAAVAAGGAYMQYKGLKQQQAGAQQFANAQQQEIDLQQQQVKFQQQQVQLDYARQQRQLIRNSIIARANTRTVATAQGAQLGTAVPGAYGQIGGEMGGNAVALSQNFNLGQQRFGNEYGMLNAYRMAASGNTMMYGGMGMSSLGGALMHSAGMITAEGSTMFNAFNNYFNPKTNNPSI